MRKAATLETGYSRLSCRVSTKIKEQVETAASLMGQSITDFTESALADRAQAVLAQHERIQLSERGFRAFVAAIEAPAPPTTELQNALVEYRRLKAEHPEANL